MNKWLEIVRGISCSICQALSEEEKLPEVERTFVKYSEMRAKLEAVGLECMIKDKPGMKPDYWVACTERETWQKLVPYLTFPAEYYIGESPDCDDYAKRASVEASFKFHLGSCLQAWGWRPDPSDPDKQVRHAFNLVYLPDDEKLYALFEPNAGFIEAGQLFDYGDFGYRPLQWK